jgi:hypothetical protein
VYTSLSYELLVQERLSELQRMADAQRVLRQLRPKPVPLRRRSALALGGLLIVVGHRLLRASASATPEARQPLRR